MKPVYRHLFFDLDRTLWDMDRNSKETLTELYHHHKLLDRGIRSADEFVQHYLRYNDILWDRYRRGLIDKASLRVLRFRQSLAHFGVKDEALATAFGDDYVNEAPKKTYLLPGAIELLEELGQHFTLHIITNGFEEVQHVKLRNCAIDRFFSEIVTSEKAGCTKPDKRIFAYALRASGAQRHEALMIGDDLETDIEGAQKAGWDQAWLNTDKAPAKKTPPTYIISELQELKQHLFGA